MPTPYVGEIYISGFNFAPVGFLPCQGQLLSISDYEVLYNLIGTTYGGDGINTFGIPDFRGRAPICMGSSGAGLSTYVIGKVGGTESVTLTSEQMPSHTHNLMGSSSLGDTAIPTGHLLANTATLDKDYITTTTSATKMSDNAISYSGGNQPHENMPPFLVLNFFIAYTGIYPTQG